MAQLWMDGFDHYGGSLARMKDGVWGSISNFNMSLSSSSARTGGYSLRVDGNSGSARRVLGAELDTVIVSVATYLEGLPTVSNAMKPIKLLTGANAVVMTLTVRPDGVLEARNPSGSILGSTTGPVLVSRSWQHVECKVFRSSTVGTIEVRVDEVTVLNLAALNLGSVNIAQYATANEDAFNFVAFKIDDLIVRDTTGAFNNDFQGDLRVATLQPVGDGANQGWAARSIQKLGSGVLDLAGGIQFNAGIAYNDNAALEIGSGDFAIETFARWDVMTTGTQIEQLLGKWREDDNTRSWRLIHKGPDNNSQLVFVTNSLGTLADEVEVITFPFAPIIRRWYHIAVSRDSGTLRMFIDGVQVGVDTAESRTYFNGSAQVMISGQQSTSTNSIILNTALEGWLDGTRITIGSARYTGNFTPPTTSLVDDANTALLLNYEDVVNTDESVNAFVGTLINAPIVFPDDALAFQTIDGLTPDDQNFIEADLIPATGTLTLTANPLDTETVTIGATTYTYQTALVDLPDNVLIGATTTDSLNNLRSAVNLEAGEGVSYGTGTLANVQAALSDLPGDQVLATARTAGTAANSEPTTTTITGGSWSAATLLGGLDIPTNSEFTVSALPPEVTGIRAVALVGRNFKRDSGSSSMQMSLVTLSGGVAVGADRAVTLTPTYYEDTIEQDPNTAGALTPTTVIGSRFRVDRTL